MPPLRAAQVLEGKHAEAGSRLKKGSKLNKSDLRNGQQGQMRTAEVVRQLQTPASARTSLLNSITEIKAGELNVSLPRALEAQRVSNLWWPVDSAVQTFLLLSMRQCSMSYHLDLWATAVFYNVRWGCKVFALAPPTEHNLKLLRAWQVRGELDSGEAGGGAVFPRDLQGFTVAVLEAGSAVAIPAGWIHAVYTPEDSCVFGWNFHTCAQLSTSLEAITANWGEKMAEMCARAHGRAVAPPRARARARARRCPGGHVSPQLPGRAHCPRRAAPRRATPRRRQTRAFTVAKLDAGLWQLATAVTNSHDFPFHPFSALTADLDLSRRAVARSMSVLAEYLTGDWTRNERDGKMRGHFPRVAPKDAACLAYKEPKAVLDRLFALLQEYLRAPP